MAKLLDGWKEGQRGIMSVTKESNPKTLEQLGYYHAVILPVALKAFKEDEHMSLQINIGGKIVEMPLSKEYLDLFLKMKFAEYDGQYTDKSEMSKLKCSEFESFVIKWLAKWFNCHVPLADKAWRDKPQPEKEG